uniref:Uncharacterized protein n=1 Tax=viral metagenome TaxID=1070528 RepID=A0A6C0B6M2_9ZZZZ
MDDFVLSNLNESRNEWCSRLVAILSPLVMEGVRSIFNESWKLSLDTNEVEKYLMTFQNFLCRVPKWNPNIIENEKCRIVEKSGCNYLEDLITCVHVIQLKVLTCVRVGTRQKKIDISIPKLNDFIHKVYINTASKVYRNAYLFDKHASAIVQQRNNREFEVIVEECILRTIRESIPTEAIVRAYLDVSVEQEEEEVFLKEEDDKTSADKAAEDKPADETPTLVEPEAPPSVVPSITNIDDKPIITKLSFNDIDQALNEDGRVEEISAPKTEERLEDISRMRYEQRRAEEEDDDNDRIKISDDVELDLGAMDLGGGGSNNVPIHLDIEEFA